MDIDIKKILNSSDDVVSKNIEILSELYYKNTGRKLNKSCPSCVREMILTLKSVYNMSSFKFKKPNVQYKNKRGDKKTISNSTMTDEGAVEFLKTNTERIGLFSEYPSNWKKLISGEQETEEEKEKRLAIEAEIAESKKKKEGSDSKEKQETEEEKSEEKVDGLEVVDSEEVKPLKDDLMKKSLKELRSLYPDVKATSIEDFVNKVLGL